MAAPLSIPDVDDRSLRVLAIGAHSDDIEIGCGGTVLTLLASRKVDMSWVVLGGADAARAAEAEASAEVFLRGAESRRVVIGAFRDAFMPHEPARVKEFFADLRALPDPDLILTHQRADLHQDHRFACELTWQTFRANTILEYEVPKWDGDLGSPNVYVPLSDAVAEQKVSLLMDLFGSQREKDWFDEDTFRGLMRLRALECRAPERAAEAFYAPKLTLELS